MPLDKSLWRRLVDAAEVQHDRARQTSLLVDDVAADGVITPDEHRRLSLALGTLTVGASVLERLAGLADSAVRSVVTQLRTGHPPREAVDELDDLSRPVAYSRRPPQQS